MEDEEEDEDERDGEVVGVGGITSSCNI